jgi:thiamine-phosphate pyrophosphorylase
VTATRAPRLIVISDAARGALDGWLHALEALLAAAQPASVLVSLRDRQRPIRERLALGQRLRAATRSHGQALAVCDRLDLAWLLEADGVHLGEADVSVEEARAFGHERGRSWSISTACHSPEALTHTSADAALLSPISAPRKGRPALGLAGLGRALAARRARTAMQGACALYVLGGVTRHDAAQWLAAGADGVALIGELFVPGVGPELLAALDIVRRPPR